MNPLSFTKPDVEYPIEKWSSVRKNANSNFGSYFYANDDIIFPDNALNFGTLPEGTTKVVLFAK